MEMLAFLVLDVKAKAFSPPLFYTTTGLCIRHMGEMANDGKSHLSKFPKDFMVYEVGRFEDSTALFTPCSPVKLIVSINDLVNEVK